MKGSEKLQNVLPFLGIRSLLWLEISSRQRGSFGVVIVFPNQGFNRHESQVVDHEEDQVPVACHVGRKDEVQSEYRADDVSYQRTSC